MTRVHSGQEAVIPTEQSSGVSPMLERAIAAVQDTGPVGCCCIEDKQAVEIVKSVLEAIREPDLGVCMAGSESVSSSLASHGFAPCGETFTAMIDAILQGGD